MKVLMFSSDPEAEGRMKKYGEKLEKLEIIFFDRPKGRFSRFFKGYFEARKVLSREKFDLITAQEIEHSFVAYLLSKKFNVPWQMQIHTDIFSPYYVRQSALNRVRSWLAKFLVPRASCVRVVSERIRRSLERDAVVLPIFSEIKKDNQKINFPGYDFVILMVGRLAREKNFSLALAVMREIVKKYPATLLVIVGDGPERKNIEKEILDGLEANVRLEGWQSNVGSYYQSADCFLLISNYEGYGMAVVEALQNGLPIVMSDVGISHDIIKDGENGIVVPVGDKNKFVESLLRLISGPDLRRRLSENAKKTKLPYSSFEDYAEKLIASFQKCRK